MFPMLRTHVCSAIYVVAKSFHYDTHKEFGVKRLFMSLGLKMLIQVFLERRFLLHL